MVVTAVLAVSGCLGLPPNVLPVSNFELDRYMGQWFEIARLDHSFERGLEAVTATYSRRKDDGIAVLNKGYNAKKQEWSEAEGKASFVQGSTEGHLKVSFFGPFYSSYVVFELGEEYQYAYVSGPTTEYLWLLARQPTVDKERIAHFEQTVRALGYDTEKILYPTQSTAERPAR